MSGLLKDSDGLRRLTEADLVDRANHTGTMGQSGVAGLPEALAAIDTTLGVPADDGDLGTFTGATIPDNVAIKSALQALETATELRPTSAVLAASDGSSLVGFLQEGAGAVPRTARSKMRDWVNFLDFGAVGDNNTDNTAALTTALAALSAGAGRILHIPDLPFRFTSPTSIVAPNRVKIRGENPMTSQFYYRPPAGAGLKGLLSYDDVDNVFIEDLGIVFDRGGGGQDSYAIKIDGVAGPVTEIAMKRVYISDFQRFGIWAQSEINYLDLDSCRILGITNSVANGGDASVNGFGVYFGTTINGIRLRNSRISTCDVPIETSNVNQKYALSLVDNFFELNGNVGAPAEYDSLSFKNCSSTRITGNYFEANLTGTGISDSVVKLNGCRGIKIESNTFAGAIGGVSKSKNLIGFSGDCRGSTIEGNEFQDPISNYIYVADGTSAPKVHRNYYDNFGTPVKTYDAIMAKMSADKIEIDVPKIIAINTGTIAAATVWGDNFPVVGVPLDQYCSILATLQGSAAADWNLKVSVHAADVVRVEMENTKGSPNAFVGDLVLRFFKNGSF